MRCAAGAGSLEPTPAASSQATPQENPFIESFTGKLRDELLDVEAFETILEARVLAQDPPLDCNTRRPHSAFGDRTPEAFAEGWTPSTTEIG